MKSGLMTLSCLPIFVLACGRAQASKGVTSSVASSGALGASGQRDCTEAYGTPSNPQTCVQVACNEIYRTFIGTWEGPFQSYVRMGEDDAEAAKNVPFYDELKKALPSMPNVPYFRPYQNTVSYSSADCLRNIRNGDEFIIGRTTNSYPAFQILPAKVETSLMVTGTHADGTRFLRMLDDHVTDYKLIRQDSERELSVWQYTIPETDTSPSQVYTIIDGRDVNYTAAHKRNVSITMSMSYKGKSFFEGMVAFGHHIQSPRP